MFIPVLTAIALLPLPGYFAFYWDLLYIACRNLYHLQVSGFPRNDWIRKISFLLSDLDSLKYLWQCSASLFCCRWSRNSSRPTELSRVGDRQSNALLVYRNTSLVQRSHTLQEVVMATGLLRFSEVLLMTKFRAGQGSWKRKSHTVLS